MGSDVMRKFTWWSSLENKSRKSVTERGAYNGHFDQRIYETVSQTTKNPQALIPTILMPPFRYLLK